MPFENDAEIRDFIQKGVYVPVLCDILDSLGYREQAMHQRLRPLLPDMYNCGFVGRARTARWMEMDYVVEGDPYGNEIDLVDDLKPGDVIVHSTDYAGSNAPWGELLSTAAKLNGAVGCVCDSQVRDTIRIIEMGFPVYYAGIRPLDSQGRAHVMDYDVPIRCGEVLVQPGELIVADFDGIVVIPKAVEAELLGLAQEKITKEDMTRQELLEGKTLRAVYEKYGVL
ncbi:MAG: RraA family protein [Anaerolineales bacterium]|nr:RraA family protein [Anaerolineales bacterium]